MFEVLRSLPKPLVGLVGAAIILVVAGLRVYFDMKQSGEWDYYKKKNKEK